MNKKDILNLLKQYQSIHEEDINTEKMTSFVKNNNIFWSKENEIGHLTASAWIISEDFKSVLLTNHIKIKKWLQLGGHIESNDSNLFSACEREIKEESGLVNFKLLENNIFDIDIHQIPAHKNTKAHLHYDIRFLYSANQNNLINYDKEESKLVKWVEIENIEEFTNEESVLRMVRKALKINNY